MPDETVSSFNVSNKWIRLGTEYGYPQCCVTAFVKNVPYPIEHHLYGGKHNVSGFVPCPSCRQSVLEGKATLSSLIDRSRRLPRHGKFTEKWES